MTDDEIKAYIRECIGEMQIKKSNSKCLQPTLDKWFNDNNGRHEGSRFGLINIPNHTQYVLWEHIRPIVTKMCGADYLSKITDVEKANIYADAICQTIYDCLEESEDKRNEDVGRY